MCCVCCGVGGGSWLEKLLKPTGKFGCSGEGKGPTAAAIAREQARRAEAVEAEERLAARKKAVAEDTKALVDARKSAAQVEEALPSSASLAGRKKAMQEETAAVALVRHSARDRAPTTEEGFQPHV